MQKIDHGLYNYKFKSSLMKTISKTTHHINFDIFIFVMRSIKNLYFLFSLVTFFFFS
jgi:hypothetical protein